MGRFTCVLAVATFLCVVSSAVGGDLDHLFSADGGKTRRTSSADANWQDGNGDAHTLPVGVTRTLADIDGPGIVRHIWMTFYGHDPRQSRGLVLRIYWDDSVEPAVESPVGDFFAVGHGTWRSVDSIPVSVSAEGRGYNCFWPMPFHKHARITIANETEHHAGVFWYVDYEKTDEVTPQTPYFHAQYRQEYPAKAGDYLVLDTVGKGRYVGTVLSVMFTSTDWFGEGDDRFFIDGDTEPTLRGTGTEDYFGDAWGFREFQHPYRGVTVWDGEHLGSRATAYRWHIPDPIHFDESLRVTFEHKGVVRDARGKRSSTFHERPDFYSSVAFWYQTGQAKRFAKLPPADKRCVPYVHVQFEDEDRASVIPERVEVKRSGGTYAQNRRLRVMFNEPNGTFTYPFTIEKQLKGVARLVCVAGPDQGMWQVSLDDTPTEQQATIDLYREKEQPVEYLLGPVDLPAGKHEIRLSNTGKHPASAGYHLDVASLGLEELTRFEAATKPKSEKTQKSE